VANDKIIIRCRHCGEWGLLAKYYPSNYGVWDSKALAKWIEDHMPCKPDFYGPSLGGDRLFDLFTESDENYNRYFDELQKKRHAERTQDD
jgi:hypothetical protein